jgi:hypothetical protein
MRAAYAVPSQPVIHWRWFALSHLLSGICWRVHSRHLGLLESVVETHVAHQGDQGIRLADLRK